ncbi:hypothetical protein F3J38_00170 [Pantoea sp. Acro-805]|uniref:Uncharacterized protein n=1 Tax=Candidatus Pantoea formicae TaxID=2608355 RepID=A0ABX0QN34_9GAMM|nr:hypothetical protein [Pantoea formicae]NIE98488.1 hypothetical protein [Pantoea formicae]
MKSGLEAGCVALVIDSVNPENVGKSVTLLSWFEAGEFFNAPDGTCGQMPSNTGGWLCVGNIVCVGKMSVSLRDFRNFGWCIFPSIYLMPLKGDDLRYYDDRNKERCNA